MMSTMKKARNLILAIVLASIAGVGVATVANASPSGESQPTFEINASGQTYGPGTGDADPDLILAQGTNGQVGYVLRTDLVGPEMRSPDDVARWLEQFPQDRARSIPLYESDGKTVIGSFTIAAAQLDEVPGK